MNYDFGGVLTEAFPSQVTVNITEVCNLACIHCPHPVFKLSEHYKARYLEPELNKKLVDECKGRTKFIRYCAEGEPLIHPHAYDMIQYAVESGTFTTLTTNGTIMNERRTRKLLDSGLHMVDISIDAFRDKTYSQIRVNGDLKVTRENVLRLLEWSKGKVTKVVVSFIQQKENEGQAISFREFWEDKGATVIIRNLHSAAGSMTQIAKDLKTTEPRRPCVYPWERIKLVPTGFLSFCPADWVHGSSLVDYRTTTIEETWKGDQYRSLRLAHLNNDFEAHRFCGQCPDWKLTQWPGMGRSYSALIDELDTAQ